MPDLDQLLTRRAPAGAAPSSWNEATRTLDVIAATGAPVRRRDWITGESYSEVLDMRAGAVDLSRLNNGAPVLDAHDASSVRNVIGSVVRAWLADGALHATLRISEGADPSTVRKITDGTLGSLSIGYSVAPDAWREDVQADGTLRRTATRWTTLEISFVPVPGDPAARVRAHPSLPPKGTVMTETVTAPAPPADAGVRAERARASEILDAGKMAGLPAEWAQRQIAAGVSADAARAAALAELSSRPAPPITPSVSAHIVRDGVETIRTRAAAALAAKVANKAPPDSVRDIGHLGPLGLLREILHERGDSRAHRLPAAEVVTRAFTTSDAPELLLATGTRVLNELILADATAASMCCKMMSAPDFRQGSFIFASGVPTLPELTEGAEIQMSYPNDRPERFRIKTFATRFPVTRQALTNDDLGAFEPVRLFTNAVAETVGNSFVAMFTSNGPTMEDGQPLWSSAAHANSTTGSMDTAGISAGRIVMRGQRDPGGAVIAPSPAIVLVGPNLETDAEATVLELGNALVTATPATVPVFLGRMQVAVEPRLAGNTFYLFADPQRQPVLAYLYLEGTTRGAQITTFAESATDGVTFKLTFDHAIAAINYVGACRVVG